MTQRLHTRPLVAALACAALLTAASCQKSEKVITIRVDATSMTLNCLDEFELTFRPAGVTQFKAGSSGSWGSGGVTYEMREVEGIRLFVVRATGDWIRAEALKNYQGHFPNQWVFEIPLKNIENAGAFNVKGYWRYAGQVTGEAKDPLGQDLLMELPSADGLLRVAIFRVEGVNLCSPETPDAGEDPEVVETVEPSETADAVEDVPRAEDVVERAERTDPDAAPETEPRPEEPAVETPGDETVTETAEAEEEAAGE